MKKDKVNATVTLHGAAHWPLKKRNEIVKWLRKVAQDLWHDPTNYAKRFRARHLASLALLSAFLALPLVLSGCGGKDPLTIKNVEAARKAWEEDRRADLPQEKIDARNFFFDEALKYERSK